MKISIIAFVISIVTHVFASSTPSSFYSIKILKNKIKNLEIRTIEKLLNELPPSIKSNYLLQYKSKGLQGASLESPRVFLFSDDGKFYATFNDSPSLSGYNSIEILTQNEKLEFNLIEITQEKGKLNIKENPSKCMACHQNKFGTIRPLFDPYAGHLTGGRLDIWPGFFGSHGDAIPSSHKELSLFLNLKKQIKRLRHSGVASEEVDTLKKEIDYIKEFNNYTRHSRPRYKILGDKYFHSKSNYFEQRPYTFPSNFKVKYRPNYIFMQLISISSNLKIAAIETKKIKENRYVAPLTFLSRYSQSSFDPKIFNREITSLVRKKIYQGQEVPSKFKGKTFSLYEYIEYLGLERKDFSLTIEDLGYFQDFFTGTAQDLHNSYYRNLPLSLCEELKRSGVTFFKENTLFRPNKFSLSKSQLKKAGLSGLCKINLKEDDSSLALVEWFDSTNISLKDRYKRLREFLISYYQ